MLWRITKSISSFELSKQTIVGVNPLALSGTSEWYMRSLSVLTQHVQSDPINIFSEFFWEGLFTDSKIAAFGDKSPFPYVQWFTWSIAFVEINNHVSKRRIEKLICQIECRDVGHIRLSVKRHSPVSERRTEFNDCNSQCNFCFLVVGIKSVVGFARTEAET